MGGGVFHEGFVDGVILGLLVKDRPYGRGVKRVDDFNQLADAFHFAKEASPSGELIIEEYMEGPELSIDAIITGEECITDDAIAKWTPVWSRHANPHRRLQKSRV